MKKKTFLTFLTVPFIALISAFFLFRGTVLEETPICIAVVASAEDGRNIMDTPMVRGIRLYVDEANRSGGVGGRRIELAVFDDKNDKNIAKHLASEIAADRKAIAVLGHFQSGPSLSAGKVYKRNRLPAITASATAEAVTADNESYFRVVPANGFQAKFITEYVHRNLEKKSAVIISCEDDYGLSLGLNIEKVARETGIEIKKTWRCCAGDGESEKEIVSELAEREDIDMIFLCAHADEAAKIVPLLRSVGKNHVIVGSDAISTQKFRNELAKHVPRGKSPGECSDGIYAVSHFMTTVANETAYPFAEKFVATYGESPSWTSACYHDAAHVLAEAISRARIQGGPDSIRSDRLKVRNALAGFSNHRKSVTGVSGNIHFDGNGDANRPFAVGRYRGGALTPAFSQYQLLHGRRGGGDIFEKSLKGEILAIDEEMMRKTEVVYAGLRVNDISMPDVKEEVYDTDFYLWFRHSGTFEDRNIEFENSPEPLRLGPASLVEEENLDGIVTRVYHVRARFKADLDFRAYPLDRQVLRIRFRHGERRRDRLIYVPDSLSPPAYVIGKEDGTEALSPAMKSEWRLGGVSLYQDIVSNVSTLGLPEAFDSENKIRYSRFNAAIHIERKLRFEDILFVMVMAAALCLAHLIPASETGFRKRISVLMLILVANTLYHLRVLTSVSVKYFMHIESLFFGIYMLVAISVFASSFICRRRMGRA